MRRCPDCGAADSPRSCDDLFQELLALDHSRQAPWGPLHGVAVACFLLQHSGRMPPTARPLYWALLHAYLRGGLASAGPMIERVRRLNSHRTGGRAPQASDYPGAPPFPDADAPCRYDTTIALVAVDGTFPAAGYEERVQLWAADTVSAWHARALCVTEITRGAFREGRASMRFSSETTSNGVSERLFFLDGVPGVLWQSADATSARPLVLVGHGGGGGHKRAPVRWAHRLTACGFNVVAIDAPGCGDRPRSEADKRALADLRQRQAAGENVAPMIARLNTGLAKRIVPEWRAVLDALDEFADRPIGYWGMSLGSTLGIPLVAAEPRITAAVLGFASGENLIELAAQITVPVEFLLQWDDELVPRDAGLAVFDALASREKTLHVNPGRHTEMPAFELDSAERFFTRHLTAKSEARG